MVALARLLPLLVLLGISGCNWGGIGGPASPPSALPTPPPPASNIESIGVSPSTLTLLVGATGIITATPRDASGGSLVGKVITWSSSMPSVATVSNGVVTAVGVGMTTIGVVSEGKVAQVTVTVTTVPVDAVVVLPASASIEVGLTQAFTATVFDAAHLPLAGRSIVWSSADPAVATVNGGVVTGVGAGTTMITATSEGKSSSAQVSVVLAPTLADGLVVGPNTNCFTRNGTRACWGRAVELQIGNGITTNIATPTPVAHNPAMAILSLGYSHSCGLSFSGFPFCWGLGRYGAIGDGATTNDHTYPAVVNTLKVFTAIDVSFGGESTCGLEANGSAWCWGRNIFGGLGDGTVVDRISPVQVAGLPPVVEIDVGESFSCARTGSGEVWCWGRDVSGELGRGAAGNNRVPQQVSGGHVFADLTVGVHRTCGLKADGSAWCWGEALAGVGGVFGESRNVPSQVVGAPPFVQLSIGRDFACGRTAAGAAWCWGGGNNGELGTGNTGSTNVPVAVSGGLIFSDLQSGIIHSCGRSGSQIWCWGANASFQLGVGPGVTGSTVPVQVVGTL